MKTKLGLMVACTALAMAAETGNAQSVVWASGGRFYISVGTPCPPPRVVTYVPVVTEPACAWGLGPRTVMVPSYRPALFYPSPQPVYHGRPDRSHFGGRHPYAAPPVVTCRPSYGHRPAYAAHGDRGASHSRDRRR
jgi:hypothetical protein